MRMNTSDSGAFLRTRQVLKEAKEQVLGWGVHSTLPTKQTNITATAAVRAQLKVGTDLNDITPRTDWLRHSGVLLIFLLSVPLRRSLCFPSSSFRDIR